MATAKRKPGSSNTVGSRAVARNRIATMVVAMAALALVVAACAADESDTGAAAYIDRGATLIVANSPGTITTNGPQRMLLALVGDGENEFFGDSAQPAAFEFTSFDDSETTKATASYLSTSGVSLGLYVAEVEFPTDGRWRVRVAGSDSPAGTMEFEVSTDSVVPDRGDPAPRSDTPIATDLDAVAAISTDTDPDLSLYDLTVAEAVANGRPTVIAFATPAFCQTALCGPTLDIVKEATAGRDDLDVVHVEPFEIEAARNGTLTPVPTMFEWQLVSEPWVFVVDAEGSVTSGFEGTIGTDELMAAIDAVS